ncbi:MAG: ERF family protein [Pseudoalteromonas sp.]|uniref:ERF family protein n=1 Tax=Pseudoalteromonas sp. TaxID=53249 RepID=UPI001D889B3E|nr:ERF family protein [Pseudoalteromonas sp.]NRA78771.1 ERF family protein [Pseudoalteromonas sp.]
MSILQKLQKIQNELKVHKGQRNKFGNYNFRSAEDILESLKPFEVQYKVLFRITEKLISLPLSYKNEEFSLVNEKGDKTLTNVSYSQGNALAIESIASIYDLEEQELSFIESAAFAVLDFDAKGMQNPQRTGSASSYAKKYALGNLLLIDDTKDSDASNDHSKASKTPQLNLGTTTFQKAKSALKEGKVTLEQIKKKYSVSASVEKQLIK